MGEPQRRTRWKTLKLDLSCIRKSSSEGCSSAASTSAKTACLPWNEGTLDEGNNFEGDSLDTKYEVGEVLGSGTMSIVYRAIRHTDSRPVAVKRIASPDEELRASFLTEYELLSPLSHGSVLRMQSCLVTCNFIMMIMELCEDGSLDSYVNKNGPLDEEPSTPLFKQLLQAVDYIHAKRIVHRDLKPENVLLKDGGRTLKVADFGSATKIGADADNLMLSERGTKLFSSPEQILGRIWNERIDIWACGLVMYFTVRGCLPLDCGQRLVRAHFMAGRLPPIEWSGISMLLAHIISQSLAVDFCNRPPAMELLWHQFFCVRDDVEENPRRGSCPQVMNRGVLSGAGTDDAAVRRRFSVPDAELELELDLDTRSGSRRQRAETETFRHPRRSSLRTLQARKLEQEFLLPKHFAPKQRHMTF